MFLTKMIKKIISNSTLLEFCKILSASTKDCPKYLVFESLTIYLKSFPLLKGENCAKWVSKS